MKDQLFLSGRYNAEGQNIMLGPREDLMSDIDIDNVRTFAHYIGSIIKHNYYFSELHFIIKI